MQQMMCHLTAWSAKIGIIQLFNRRILMRLSDRIVLIRVIENLGAERSDIYGVAYRAWLLWLAAAVDTSAWTAHNLDEVVFRLAGFHFVK